MDTKARAGPLAQLIVDRIIEGADPDVSLWYNPQFWNFPNNTAMPADFNWLENPVQSTINGRMDAFSIRRASSASFVGFFSDTVILVFFRVVFVLFGRIGQECQPFPQEAPSEPLFDPTRVVIVSNGRYAWLSSTSRRNRRCVSL